MRITDVFISLPSLLLLLLIIYLFRSSLARTFGSSASFRVVVFVIGGLR